MNNNNTPGKGTTASVVALVVVLAVAAGAGWLTRGIWAEWLPAGMAGDNMSADHTGHESGSVIYTCPMHPQIVRDKPGDCPICGMTLVRKEVDFDTAHEGHEDMSDMKMSDSEQEPRSTIYHCPMCPGSESYEPGKCPTCGMNLVPKDNGTGTEHEGHNDARNEGQGSSVEYFCPMCPEVVSDKPGNCPTCGMKLFEREPETSAGHEEQPGNGDMAIQKAEPKQKSTIYFCPMCPGSEQYEPGTCTTCGMKLMEKEPEHKPETVTGHEGHTGMGDMKDTDDMSGMQMDTDAGKTGGADEKIIYTCPMHPQIVRDQPGNCPICGMTLVKKKVGTEDHSMHMAEPLPEGVRRVSLDPREVAIANVKTDVVGYTAFSRDVSTVGRIEYNEDTIEAVAAWFPGRIEDIRVRYVGETVRKGQTVMTVYSPELVASQKELLIARETMDEMSDTGYDNIRSHASDMLESARDRLRRWGLSESQISSIETTGKFMEQVKVTSPVAGTVVALGVREGGYVKEGTELFKVADLGSVWMNAEVYEYEFSKAALGAKVVVTAEAYPSMTFEGRVSFISPDVDMQSRTVKVRITLPNPGGLLKPGMFVDARILSEPRRSLTVPASAVLYTGKRNIVWVEVGKGTYESRDVKLGTRSEGYYEVVSGISEGDRVVTQGGFLIDSEAELNSSMTGGGHQH